MKIKSNFIQERMLLGKKETITYLKIFLVIPLIYTVVSIYGMIHNIIVPEEITQISSIEEIEEFYNAELSSASLQFDEGINTKEIIQIETKEQEEMKILGTRRWNGF